MNPKNEYAWYNLAWAQYLTGDPAASTGSIKKALQINPGNAIIKHGKEMMEKGAIPSHLRKTAQMNLSRQGPVRVSTNSASLVRLSNS